MDVRLPNEIVCNISMLVGEDSTLDLKSLTLVDHQWHAATAPLLLSTISVSSLDQIFELCDHVISSHLSSCIAKFTKTIVISGVNWEHPRADDHPGLRYVDGQLLGADGRLLIEPDIDILPDGMPEKIRAALLHLTSLDGLEWYGSFPGDYHLVRFLQQAHAIVHLNYAIGEYVDIRSPAYFDSVFSFAGLTSLTVAHRFPCQKALFRSIQMAKCNPGLQRIVFDCEGLGYLPVNDRPPLANLICDPSLSHNSIFVWPDLQYLVIRPLDTWWKSSQGVELLAKFLAAHSKLETLRIFEYFGPNPPSPLTPPFSLAPYPDSLPSLKKLMGSARLIAGVLESRGACSSVQVVVQNELPEQEQNGWAHVQRAIHALEKAPGNQIRRLSLQAPRFNHELYSKLAQLAPGIQFLELFPDMNDPVTPDAEFEAVVTKTIAGLNKFTNLSTIGHHMAANFVSLFDSGEEGLFELARQLPRLNSIHCGRGLLVTCARELDGRAKRQITREILSNEDYDWIHQGVDWSHRPMSYRLARQLLLSDPSNGLDALFPGRGKL